MFALIGGLRGILAALGGAGAAFLVFAAWNTVLDNPRVHRAGKAEGVTIERQAWEEARRRLLAEMAEDKRQAQSSIDETERVYLAQRDRDAETIRALEEAISEQEKADAEAGDDACVVRPYIGRGLRDRLDQIGRDTP